MTDFPDASRSLGYLPFIHYTTDELHDALFVVADAARGLRALLALLRAGGDMEAVSPTDLAGLIEPVYQRLAAAVELEPETQGRKQVRQ